jgi:hypothetical protein
MAGINRALSLNESRAKTNFSTSVKCVFISHQKDDTIYCKKIANYLMDAGIDVYFDEFDNDLKFYRQTNNPNGIVLSIKKGINISSHMLCVISPKTLFSKWVPWEIGYGHESTIQGAITIKGIKDEDLPDYLKTTNMLRGTKSLNNFIQNVTGKSEYILENYNLIKKYTTLSHPLDDVLDWNQ